jgi:hypothetical protein
MNYFNAGTTTMPILNTGSNTPDLFIQFLLGALCAAALVWIFSFVLNMSKGAIINLFIRK